MRIALFASCLTDTLFPQTTRATVSLLERLGHEVVVPAQQTCCGQMHHNSGYAAGALGLVRATVAALERESLIVCPSASCTAMIRCHYEQLARACGDPELGERAAALAVRTFELCELLCDVLGVCDVGAVFPRRVAYHPSCHGLRQLRLGQRPLRLLSAVAGLELVKLGEAQECCGFGGTFAVSNPAVSGAILADKLRHLQKSGAEVCVATDSSCLMHIDGGIRARGLLIQTMHLAQVLACTG